VECFVSEVSNGGGVDDERWLMKCVCVMYLWDARCGDCSNNWGSGRIGWF